MTIPLIVVLCCIPVLCIAGIVRGYRLAKADRRRIEEYRNSPDSRLIILD